MLTRLRRIATLITLALGLLLGLVGGWASGASAQDTTTAAEGDGRVNVIEVSGYLDPVLVDFIHQQLDAAEADPEVRALVLQMNSPGALVNEATFTKLVERLASTPVSVTMWVGPSGAKVKGRSAQLMGIMDDVGMANGSDFGDLGDPVIDEALFSSEFAEVYPQLRNKTVEFKDQGDDVTFGFGRLAPTVILYLLDLPGFESSIDSSGDESVRVPDRTRVAFGALSVFKQQVHNLGSPPVAYLLFILGMALLLFEFFTAGVGIAGIIGAGSFIGGAYGLDVLPARWWAVGLLVLSMLAFAVDVQTGVPRFWSVVGTIMLVVGSMFLYNGISLGWVALLTGLIGILLAMINGMPSMVRTRFSTATIGRQNMLGQYGEVVEAVAPDGVVLINGARWRARTNRATPIAVGEQARVAEIDGLTLEVEPEEGAARDYRERGPKDTDEAVEHDELADSEAAVTDR